MNRYDIASDYKNKFVETYKNVIGPSVHPFYISINGDVAKVSKNPYSMEQSEHALVIFRYSYIVLTQSDMSMVPLFFNSNGEIEDYIELDGWKMWFSAPKTGGYRCNYTDCFFSNGALRLEISSNCFDIVEKFNLFWELFSEIRKCTTQLELDFLKKIFVLEKSISELKGKNIRQEAQIDAKNTLIESYKELLQKINILVTEDSE